MLIQTLWPTTVTTNKHFIKNLIAKSNAVINVVFNFTSRLAFVLTKLTTSWGIKASSFSSFFKSFCPRAELKVSFTMLCNWNLFCQCYFFHRATAKAWWIRRPICTLCCFSTCCGAFSSSRPDSDCMFINEREGGAVSTPNIHTIVWFI